jgi:hypothetical protein
MPVGWRGREGLGGQRGRGLSGRLGTHRFDRPCVLGRLANVSPFVAGIKGNEYGLAEWNAVDAPNGPS